MKDKVSFKEKLAFGFGDVGCNFVWTTVSAFLTLYYTDNVGLSAAVVGTIMLVTRLLDGVTDLCFGTILDRTHTKMGKARPWILWSTPMMAIGLILLFNVPMGLENTGKVVYASVTYVFVAAFAYTAYNLSYNALLSLMTDDQQTRASASTIRFICTMITAIMISSITIPLVEKFGWGTTSVIYAVLSSIAFMITFFGTKERYTPQKAEMKEDISVIESFKVLFKNRYFISITLLFVITYLIQGAGSGIGIYFARDILGDAKIYGLITMATMIPLIFGLPLFPILTRKIGKWKCMMGGLALQMIGSIIVLLAPTNLTVVLIGLVIKGVGVAPNTAGLFAIVADAIDYGEWKTGVRQDGLTNSATSFGMKVGTGLGSALVGWGLALGKYDATLAVQSESALNVIKFLYVGLPIIGLLFAMIFLGYSNIDKIYPQIEEDLKQRREK
ncbi:MAG TPA: sugar transporter [Lachnoclostridium phytofermentans]|uniref:Sugar transporter n=1 Tax=Lachnoclostridium phytofermentans TaxID=66219 RepID=A0A3D2X7Q8_9FIRM|nr:sugar transporter [Lachnoclostridium phytofermentans]